MEVKATKNIVQFKELLKEWLDSKVVYLCKMRTYLRYREIAENHLKADIGEYRIQKITSQQLSEYLAMKYKS